MNTLAVTAILVATVQLTAPLLWVALGEIFGELGGVLNIGAEGTMLMGAWASATVTSFGSGPWVAALAGIGAGALMGLIMAILYLWRRVDQVIGGIMINLFALGFTTTMWTLLQGDAHPSNASRIAIPLLSRIPVVGPAIFSQNYFVYAAFVAVPVTWSLIHCTRWGLRLRAAGEGPAALDAAGLSVNRLRLSGMIVATSAAGIGGATLVLTSASGSFVTDMTAGSGYIALGVVILARWNPSAALIVTVVFGFLKSLQFQAQVISGLSAVPTDVWLAMPYVIGVVAVALAKAGRFAPIVGVPWRGR